MSQLFPVFLLYNILPDLSTSYEIDCSDVNCRGTVRCDPNDECYVHCDEAWSCAGATIQCPSSEDCSIYCQGEGACDGTTINGPSSSDTDLQVVCEGSEQGPCANLEVIGGESSSISVDCSGDDSACLNSIFRASSASSFTLSDCTSSKSCLGITVYCPPNVNGNRRCTLQGNNQLGGSSASNAISIFAPNSWSDVRFQTASKSNNYLGTMHCTADYSASCAIDADEWQCDEDDASSPCSDGDAPSSPPSDAPTVRPTPELVPPPVAAPLPTPNPTAAAFSTPTPKPSAGIEVAPIAVTPPPTPQGLPSGPTQSGAVKEQLDGVVNELSDGNDPTMGHLVLLLAGTAVILCCCFCCLVFCAVRKQSRAQQIAASLVDYSKGIKSPVFHPAPPRDGSTAGGGGSDSEDSSSSDTERDLEMSMEIGMLDYNRKRLSGRRLTEDVSMEHQVAIVGVSGGGGGRYFDHHEDCGAVNIAMPSTRGAEPSDDELDDDDDDLDEVDPTDSGERLSDELWREELEGDPQQFVPRQSTGEDDVVIGSPTFNATQSGDDAPRLLLPPTRGGKEESDDDEDVPPPPAPPIYIKSGGKTPGIGHPVKNDNEDPPAAPPLFSQSRVRRHEGSR